ncbi:MAG TPA: hypothetical protein VF263_01400 [Longimicrobiaceae bacterium]
MNRPARLYSVPLLSLALIGACVAATRSAGREAAPRCAVREVSRTPLAIEDGRLLYVEPAAFSVSRGEVLLAGTPNFLARLDRGGRVTGMASDSVLGAVVARDGKGRAVPSPIDGRLVNGLRAAALEGGGWAVVFAEVRPYTGDSRPDTAVRLWHGVYDGRRWVRLEELPLPPHRTLHPHHSSQLVRRGDTLSWAMTMTAPVPGVLPGNGIVLYERRGGRWSYEAVPTFHSEAELARSDTLGLLLVVVQPDSTARGGDGNSLFLWARRPAWRRLRRIVHGYAEGRVYDPSLTATNGEGVLSWRTPVGEGFRSRREVRAMVGRVEERNEPAITIDSSVAFQRLAAPIRLPDGSPLWVTDHEVPDEPRREVRLTLGSARSATLLKSIPSPYIGWISATTPAPWELLVTGFHYVPDRYAVSLLLRARVECRGTAR